MANPRCLAFLLVATLLALSFSQGVVEGRKVAAVMRAVGRYGRWRSPLHGAVAKLQQQGGAAGMVSTVMDYAEPKANTNPHTGVPATPDPTSPPAQ